jgi:transposase
MSYHAAPMDNTQASRDELLALIAQQQATIAALEARVRDLERRLTAGGGRGMPGLKPEEALASAPRPRKRRLQNCARRRQAPTRRVLHAVAACPGCGTALVGGSVKRTREVLDLVLAPLDVVEHVYLERRCPGCGRRCVPPPELAGQVVGQQRLGIGLLSLIATLREEGRLPVATIQWYLATYHQCHLSRGAIVGALQRVAAQARPVVAAGLIRVRASPYVQADETGWRENGRNGYVWTFSTPTEQVFVRRRRTKEVVDEVLGAEFSGVLVSDFYAAYHHYPGLKQRCWVHLLREIHDLKALYPADRALARWAARVHGVYPRAVAYRGAGPPRPPPGPPALRAAIAAVLCALRRPTGRGPAEAVRAHPAASRRALRLRGRADGPSRQQWGGAQSAAPRHQPQDQRRHPLPAGHRHQNGPQFPLWHVARSAGQSLPCLPPVTRPPSKLNSHRGSRAGGSSPEEKGALAVLLSARRASDRGRRG